MSDTSPHTNVDPLLQEDFNTEPLSGLCALPAHLMSPEQMRQHVIVVRQMRQSAQVFKVETEQHEKIREVKVKSAPKKADISALEELF